MEGDTNKWLYNNAYSFFGDMLLLFKQVVNRLIKYDNIFNPIGLKFSDTNVLFFMFAMLFLKFNLINYQYSYLLRIIIYWNTPTNKHYKTMNIIITGDIKL